MNITFGILAHVDAGKTTFSEALLYHTRSIKRRGRVDHQDAFLDSHELEKQRGITIFSDQAFFTIGDDTYYLIDTPGHVDFSPEMERAVQVMDYAVVIISGVEGIEGHTETVWRLLRKHRVPAFIFINKMDRTGADAARVLEEIRTHLTADVCDLSGVAEGQMPEEVIEFLAERDEELLEHYMEQGYHADLWLTKLRQMVRGGRVVPCLSGSALHDLGVREFLDLFTLLTETEYDESQPFAGRVYKIRHDEQGVRLTYIKAISGALHVRDDLPYGDGIMEKVTQIRKVNGHQVQQVDRVTAGELFAVTGLTAARVGDGVGACREQASFELVPTLRSKVVAGPGVNMKEVYALFRMLDAEDPSLHVTWEERLQQIHIHVMGKIQLEVLKHIVADRFQLQVDFEPPEILYRETIEQPVMGYGHFEPLRHYAEVHLRIEPAPRNSGITFANECRPDDLPVGMQNLVKQHIFEREHHGLLTGSPLTDVKITLVRGRAHNKHTHGGDFREATFRALRQGLEKARNILLEPVYEVKIQVQLDHMGRVLSDIQAASGRFEPPITEGDQAIIHAVVPVATFIDYGTTLASFTKGKGRINMAYAGYERCHNEEEVIARIGYDKDADPEYTSSSIFCAKGQSFSVPWHEAEAMMHCPIEE